MSTEQNMLDIAFEKASEEMAGRVPERELAFEDIFDMWGYAKTRAGLDLSDENFTYDHEAWELIYLFWGDKIEEIIGPDKKAILERLVEEDDALKAVSAEIKNRLGI